jgi:hypothetical protein
MREEEVEGKVGKRRKEGKKMARVGRVRGIKEYSRVRWLE